MKRRKTERREHDEPTLKVIWTLHCMGYSSYKIYLETEVPKSTVTAIIKRLRKCKEEPWKRALRKGGIPKLDERAERRLVRFMANNPFETISSAATPSKSGYQMHVNTVRKYLAKHEVYAFKPRVKPYLKESHKKARLLWAYLMKDLTLEDWELFGFSDESTFEIGLDIRPAWVRRRKGEAYESKHIKPSFKSGRSSVGIWGIVSLKEKGSMVILRKGKRMNGITYQNQVLIPHVAPFMDRLTELYGDAVF
jgi:hypothetical protein